MPLFGVFYDPLRELRDLVKVVALAYGLWLAAARIWSGDDAGVGGFVAAASFVAALSLYFAWLTFWLGVLALFVGVFALFIFALVCWRDSDLAEWASACAVRAFDRACAIVV
jgi:hypothetical protein